MTWLRRREAGTRILRVDGDRYSAVGAAVRSARDGDVIEIAGGTYTEQLVIDKAVELRPVEGTGAVGLVHDDGPLVLHAGATVRDIMITAGGAGRADALVVTGPGVAPTVVGCAIGAGRGAAIRVTDGATPLVRDCRVEGSDEALLIDGAAGRYEGCEFVESSHDAVVVLGGATPELADCTVTRPGQSGFRVSGTGSILTLHECLIDRAESHGVWVSAGGRAVLAGTTLRNVRDNAVSVGERGSSVELTGCTITGGTRRALSVHARASATLADCAFTGVDSAITVSGPDATASITGGSIEDAAQGAVHCTDRAAVTVTGTAVRGGAGLVSVSGQATLVAEGVTVEDGTSVGFLVAQGQGRFIRCQVTGPHLAGARVLAGQAVLDRCEVSGGRSDGFQLEGGEVTLTGCVAHHNAGSGFDPHAGATLTACASYANGEPDEVGIQDGAPVPGDLAPGDVRVGPPPARQFDDLVDDLEDALEEVREFVEAERTGALLAPVARAEAERLLEGLAEHVAGLRRLDLSL